jgi:hypothetical protein
VRRKLLSQRGRHEGEHRVVRKALLIVLGVVLVPFQFMLVTAIARSITGPERAECGVHPDRPAQAFNPYRDCPARYGLPPCVH